MMVVKKSRGDKYGTKKPKLTDSLWAFLIF